MSAVVGIGWHPGEMFVLLAESRTMLKSHRAILELLSKHRKPISATKLAEEASINKAGVNRPVSALESEGFVERKKAGRENLVAITKTGREYLRFNPVLDEPEQTGTHGKYADAQRLWKGLGLEKGITVSSDSFKIKDLYIRGRTRRIKDMASATKYLDFRRNRTNVWFTPASTTTKRKMDRTEKIFEWSHALWLDLDMPRNEKMEPLPEPERNRRLSETLQNIVEDGLAVYAEVDSGAGYHIYFKVQNKIKDSERLEKALKGLAVKYAGMKERRTHATHATANLRVPGSVNIRKFGNRTVRRECKLIDMKPDNLCRLADIEKVLGYNWIEEKRKGKQEQSDIQDKVKTEKEDSTIEPRRGGRANIWRIIKNGYDPAYQEDLSAADYGLMCKGIRRGYRKETIFGWFTDTENGICIYKRMELYGKRNRDVGYLERTYKKAWGDVKKKG
jgi:predicted transcriptional regulator